MPNYFNVTAETEIWCVSLNSLYVQNIWSILYRKVMMTKPWNKVINSTGNKI